MIFMIHNKNVLDHKDSILNKLYRYIFCYHIEIIYYFEYTYELRLPIQLFTKGKHLLQIVWQ